MQAAKDRISKQTGDFQRHLRARLAELDVGYTPKKVSFEPYKPQVAGTEVITTDEDGGNGVAVLSIARPQRSSREKVVAEDNVPNLPVAKIHTDDLHDEKDKGILVENEEDTVIY